MKILTVYQNLYPDQKKMIKIVGLVIFLLAVMFFFFNYSLLTVSGIGAEDKTVRINKDGKENRVLNLKDNSKLLLMRRGSYQIVVSSGEKLSAYQKSLSFFWHRNISVEVKPLQKSRYLGIDTYECSKRLSERSLFFPCKESFGGAIRSINNNGEQKVIGFMPSDISSQEEENVPVFFKPYGDELLEFRQQGEIYVGKRSPDGNVLGTDQIKLSGAGNQLSDETLTVLEGSSDYGVAVIKNNELVLYKKPLDGSHDSVDLSGFIRDDQKDFRVIVKGSKKYVYITITKNFRDIESHEDPNDTPEEIHQDEGGGSIIVVDVGTKEVVAEHNLPDGYIARGSHINGGGELSISPLYPEKDNLILVSSNGNSEIDLPWNDIKEICWIDDMLYYSRVTGGQIFSYNRATMASFLVYDNPIASVDNLNCNFRKVHFTLSSDTDGVIGEDLVHYMLDGGDKDSVGRVEWALPLTLAVGEDSVRVVAKPGGGLYVWSIYKGPEATRPSFERIKKSIIKSLVSQGIDPGDIEVDFSQY